MDDLSLGHPRRGDDGGDAQAKPIKSKRRRTGTLLSDHAIRVVHSGRNHMVVEPAMLVEGQDEHSLGPKLLVLAQRLVYIRHQPISRADIMRGVHRIDGRFGLMIFAKGRFNEYILSQRSVRRVGGEKGLEIEESAE